MRRANSGAYRAAALENLGICDVWGGPVPEPPRKRPLHLEFEFTKMKSMTKDINPTDEAVPVRQAIAGSPESFAQLISHHEFAVRWTLARHIKDGAAIDDLAQEVFLRAYQNLAQWQKLGNLKPWLIGVARNLAKVYIRSSTRRQARETGPLAVQLAEWRLDRMNKHTGSDESPEQTLAALQDCIAQLAPETRRVVEEHYFEGQTLEAIAKRLGRSSVSVRALLFRTRNVLLKCICEKLRMEFGSLELRSVEPAGHRNFIKVNSMEPNRDRELLSRFVSGESLTATEEQMLLEWIQTNPEAREAYFANDSLNSLLSNISRIRASKKDFVRATLSKIAATAKVSPAANRSSTAKPHRNGSQTAIPRGAATALPHASTMATSRVQFWQICGGVCAAILLTASRVGRRRLSARRLPQRPGTWSWAAGRSIGLFPTGGQIKLPFVPRAPDGTNAKGSTGRIDHRLAGRKPVVSQIDQWPPRAIEPCSPTFDCEG